MIFHIGFKRNKNIPSSVLKYLGTLLFILNQYDITFQWDRHTVSSSQRSYEERIYFRRKLIDQLLDQLKKEFLSKIFFCVNIFTPRFQIHRVQLRLSF